jgi:mRNA interferase MazF
MESETKQQSKHVKDFDGWNVNKQKINKSLSRPLNFKKGQIWWVSCGVNIGTEIDGKGQIFLRPFLVLKKNYHKSAICLPLTSPNDKERNYYFLTEIKNKKSVIVFSQIRNIDTQRFYKHYAEISEKKFEEILSKLFDYIKSPSFRLGDKGYPNYD